MMIFNQAIKRVKVFTLKHIVVIFLLSIFSLTTAAASKPTPSGDSSYVADELLVKFKTSTTRALKSNIRQRVKGRIKNTFKRQKVEHWSLPVGSSVQAAVDILNADASVDYAEPNYRRYPSAIPNDPSFILQWGLSANALGGGTPGNDMSLPLAWDITTGNANVIIAIIDDSVDINHPDLQANIWTNLGEIAGDGIDNDGNGFIDDVHGWDFVNNDNNPSADPGLGEGHGTSVAGSAGAVGNNGLGVSGVAQTVSIMPIKFDFSVAGELAAIQYAINNGAHIVNASWGGLAFSMMESGGIALLENAGILFVSAAGNSEVNNDIVLDYPSGLPNANILAVAASNENDTLTTWSQYGGMSVDIAAPGNNVYVTHSMLSVPSGYSYTSGTSFSSPYIAGLAALVKSAYPAASFQEMKGRILAGADDLAALHGLVSTSGRANAARALSPSLIGQPVLVINDSQWLDGNNNVPEAGEMGAISIALENIWNNAVGVSATLVSLDANLVITSANSSYPDIVAGANGNAIFTATAATTATGYQTYRLRLDITTIGGYVVSRYLSVGIGKLQDSVTYRGNIGQNAQDDAQLFYIDIPAGVGSVVFSSTSASDIDLYASMIAGVPPQYIDLFPAIGTLSASSPSGNESLVLPTPMPGTYYVSVYNWNGTLTPFTLTATLNNVPTYIDSLNIGDVNGDGFDDIAVVEMDSTGAKRILIKSAIDGLPINTLAFNNAFNIIDEAVLPDMNGNGVAEIVVLGDKIIGNAVIAQVVDALTGSIINNIVLNTSGWLPSLITTMNDMDGNGVSELLVLGTSGSGQVQVALKDVQTDLAVGAGVINYGKNFNIIDIEVVPDLNANGFPEIAVLGVETNGGKSHVEIRDASTGLKAVSNLFYPAAWVPQGMKVIADINANGFPEIALLATKPTAADRIGVQLRDASSGISLGVFNYGNAYAFIDFKKVPDTNGNGFAELAVLAKHKSNGRVIVSLKDSSTGSVSQNLFFNVSYVPASLVVLGDMDFDANLLPELGVLATNAASISVVQIQSPATGAVVNTVPVP